VLSISLRNIFSLLYFLSVSSLKTSSSHPSYASLSPSTKFYQQDKGGDPATFRETRAAFEVLRSMYQEGSVKNGTFTSYLQGVEESDIGK
jgi:hypothetical protein